ncbi:bile acid:Na+ symporter, BASS family [Enhydrobacter aerosaccus]|uniref:Bile acid:Na+ symporter, BASS family n=1 Tax=Enhydrobacter aerosaccus TaxID=225324 RepID=A0A1T4L9L6_9HYPH|nr:bile acid:sodium symporter [Enhydrobacter aerosaccus]SJZ51472.1 bile acid:Na+ symporter, BASS family [Enhydrobacter aerosaccus]
MIAVPGGSLDQLREYAAAALPAIVLVFMAGNLAAIGLELDFKRALAPLRNRRFVAIVLAWDWILCPGVAWLLAEIVPMMRPYALGLELIGLAPAAPFLPMMVRRANGDLAYTAAFMLIAALGTVLFMPLALPLVAPGLKVGIWPVARPLIALILLPLLAGLSIRALHSILAKRLQVYVKRVADIATLGLLVVICILHFGGFVQAIGSLAIGTQFLFAIIVTVGSYLMSGGLAPEQRSVVCLGVCTRNLGAALAPLLAVATDPRTTVMVALGVPINLIVTFVAARWLARRNTMARPTNNGKEVP